MTAWCVPTAVSLLTGIPLIHSHSRAAFIQDKKLDEVEGVYAAEAILMLREQGYVSKQIDLETRYDASPKLSTFLKDRTTYEECMPLMIQVVSNKRSKASHMVCAHYSFLADNWTMKPVAKDKFPHINGNVIAAWVVSKK